MADKKKQVDEEPPKRKRGRPKGSGVPRKNVTFKVCRECHKVKPASEFYVRKENKDGLFHSCKECMDNDGKIYTIEEARTLQPAHWRCRCHWQAA